MLRAHTRSRGLGAAAGGPSLWDYSLTTGTLPPVLSVARGTEATFVNSSGLIETAAANVALIDHHPTSLVPLGIRLESQITNYQPYSECAIASGWSVVSATAAGNTLLPNGGSGQNAAAETTSVSGHGVTRSAISISGGNRSMDVSVWIKHDPNRTPRSVITDRDGNTRGYSWDADGNPNYAETAGGAVPNQGIKYLNGWMRCVVRVPLGAGAAAISQHVRARKISDASYIGDPSIILRGWGAMITEACDYTPHLINTTGSAATRDADVLMLIDTTRAVEITYLRLSGGAAQTTIVPAGSQPAGLPACWITRVRQL